MTMLLYPIVLPFIVGIICLILPKALRGLAEALALLVSLFIFGLTIYIFTLPAHPVPEYLSLDNLSRFILLATGLFGFLITLYSISFMAGYERLNEYYAYTLWTISAACGVLVANHLILLLVFWGFLGLTLYLLIGIAGAGASDASKKTFIIVGGSDCIMILGIAIVWILTNTFQMDKIHISLVNAATTLPAIAFLCLLVASFAKAGAMPFHTWIPDCAQDAPVPVTAFLPASLDKLLGIYLLARIAMNLFVLNRSMELVLLVVGAVTIVAAVFMAMIQHDLKRLLGYHAVSQVGYMVLGIGTGNPVGIAGGLFHMLNHAIYKSCLFLTAGGVEKKTGTTDLDKLGGLARFMPVTFVTFLIAAFAISGVPPFNGFVSKWMVYQGVIELGKQGGQLWIIWLVAAIFGSALTLASFMKLAHAVFLGQRAGKFAKGEIKEVSFSMWLPMVVLAALCVIFGVFAYSTALGKFIIPAVGKVKFLGFWSPVLATLLILVGLFIGGIIYLLGRPGAVRESDTYVGGEILPDGHQVTGVNFYNTIQEIGFFKWAYQMAEDKIFDIYDQGKRFVFCIGRKFQVIHTGVLPFYLIWCLVGMIVLFFVYRAGGF